MHPGQQEHPTTLPAAPATPAPLLPGKSSSPSQEGPTLWGEIQTSSRFADGREQGCRKAAPERQRSHSEMGDQGAWGQSGAGIQPAAQPWRVSEPSSLTWDWTEMAISALQWEETLTQQ